MAKVIALVEDESAIRENYTQALSRQGYLVKSYATRVEAEQSFQQKLPDLVLLDIGLQDEMEAGFELCRMLRSLSTTLPIIFLTARDSDLDTVSGLRLGADDYLLKDISIAHLCARISALFRRLEAYQQPQQEESLIQRGSLVIDTNRFSVTWQDQLMDLTLTEFWLVHTLALHPGHVKNREQLMQDAHVVVDDATITSHIKRVRKKFIQIDANFVGIDTVYGMGYRWVESR